TNASEAPASTSAAMRTFVDFANMAISFGLRCRGDRRLRAIISARDVFVYFRRSRWRGDSVIYRLRTRQRAVIGLVSRQKMMPTADCTHLVRAGPVPAIHVFVFSVFQDVDARHKAGHDGRGGDVLAAGSVGSRPLA